VRFCAPPSAHDLSENQWEGCQVEIRYRHVKTANSFHLSPEASPNFCRPFATDSTGPNLASVQEPGRRAIADAARFALPWRRDGHVISFRASNEVSC
jgi:hypothetical protein